MKIVCVEGTNSGNNNRLSLVPAQSLIFSLCGLSSPYEHMSSRLMLQQVPAISPLFKIT